MEIWSILIFNVRRRMHMLILLQSVTIQFCTLFWNILYYKLRQSNFITNCDRLLFQSVTDYYYKVRQVLQSVTVVAKWDVTNSANQCLNPKYSCFGFYILVFINLILLCGETRDLNPSQMTTFLYPTGMKIVSLPIIFRKL